MKSAIIFGALASWSLLSAAPDAASGPQVVLTDRAASRLLDQASWGPTPAAIQEVQETGIAGWLNQQFQLNTSDIPDQPLLDSTGKSNNDVTPVQRAFIQNAVTGADQLRQRVAFALSEIWVVSNVSVRPAYAFPPYWRLFRDNAFGNYRDLMKVVTLNPAMGAYLNLANNNKGVPAKGTAANENYAREMMQLFTVGLTQLNLDGSPALDSSGKPIPTYTQAQVTDMARALTGWTYAAAPNAASKVNNPAYYFGQMIPSETEHDTGSKIIIGNTAVPAGQTAEQDLDFVLNTLMAQPTIAPFVSRQLIQHLVTSNPSSAYIARVAGVFQNNGQGVSGDMMAVITAILTDPEARAADNPNLPPNPGFGHLREPLLFVTNLLRGLNAALTSTSAVYNLGSQLGQNLFAPSSVFSYFSPMYQMENGTPAPEFQIYSTQTAASRANIVNAAIFGTLDKNTKLDYSEFLPFASDTASLLDHIAYVFLHHSMSLELQQAATTAVNAATDAQARVQAALYVVLTSSEYQVIQ